MSTIRPPAVPACWRVQASAASSRATRSCSTVRVPAVACADHRQEGGPALLGIELVVGVAKDVQRPAAQRRGVERALLVGGAAEVDQPAAGAQRAQRRRRPGRRTAGRGRGPPARRPRRHPGVRPARRTSSAVERDDARPRRAAAPAPAPTRIARTPRPAPAPCSRASCTAAWPTTPPAPSTSTVSPGDELARARSAPSTPRPRTARAPPPRRGRAVGAAATTSVGGDGDALGHAAVARAPCRRWSANHTAVPASSVPTPCTPGTYGVRARRSTTCPDAQSRSSGVIGAAVTVTSTSPGPGSGSARSATCGGSPGRAQLARPASAPAAGRSRSVPRAHGTPARAAVGRRAGLAVLERDDELLLGAEHDVAVEVLGALLEQVGDQRLVARARRSGSARAPGRKWLMSVRPISSPTGPSIGIA